MRRADVAGQLRTLRAAAGQDQEGVKEMRRRGSRTAAIEARARGGGPYSSLPTMARRARAQSISRWICS
jgi:hypothetical protein